MLRRTSRISKYVVLDHVHDKRFLRTLFKRALLQESYFDVAECVWKNDFSRMSITKLRLDGTEDTADASGYASLGRFHVSRHVKVSFCEETRCIRCSSSKDVGRDLQFWQSNGRTLAVTVLRRLSKMILSQEWSSEWNLLSTGRVLFIDCQTRSVGFLNLKKHVMKDLACFVDFGCVQFRMEKQIILIMMMIDEWFQRYILMIASSLIITSRKLRSRIFYSLDAQVTSISV